MSAEAATPRRVLRPPDIYIGAALVLLVLVAFWPLLDNGFVSFDDPGYVTDNPQVGAGLTLDGTRWAFTTGAQGNWHPLTWLSHMLDVTLFGLDPRGHHLTSLLLHLGSSLLLFVFLGRATGAPWLSGFVAGLFAVHPLRVESVAWVAERKDVLSALFFMLTLLAWLAYARRPRPGRYLRVSLLFALGLLAKPMLVTLPFVLLLLDFWPLNRVPADQAPSRTRLPAFPRLERATWRRLIVEKLPLLALALASSVLTFLVQRSGAAVNTLEQHPVTDRLANAALAYLGYLRRLAWPDDLAFFYPLPERFSVLPVLLAAALLLALSLVALRMARRAPYLFTGWYWYVGMLVPVIGLVQVGGQSMADRYTYLPLIGLSIALAWGVDDLLGGWRHRSLVLGTVACVTLLALVPLTRSHVRYWKDSVTLYERALSVTEGNFKAHDLLGVEMFRLGRLDEAIEHYEAALRHAPGYAFTHNNLGVALERQGRSDEAIEHYRAALEANERYAEAHGNLGIALAGRQRLDEAIVHFQRAVELDPDDADAQQNLGLAWSVAGEPARALPHYLAALRLDPDLHVVALAAARILATDPDPALRDGAEAVRLAEHAIRSLGNRDPRWLDTLAAAYAESGRFEDAVRTAALAAEIAESRGDAPLADRIRGREALYRTGSPYREPAGAAR
jgi:tetratricopeptide (TPR) repeat protein